MNAKAKVQDLKRALKGRPVIAELTGWEDPDLLFDLFPPGISFRGPTLKDDATLTESGIGAAALLEVQTGNFVIWFLIVVQSSRYDYRMNLAIF